MTSFVEFAPDNKDRPDSRFRDEDEHADVLAQDNTASAWPPPCHSPEQQQSVRIQRCFADESKQDPYFRCIYILPCCSMAAKILLNFSGDDAQFARSSCSISAGILDGRSLFQGQISALHGAFLSKRVQRCPSLQGQIIAKMLKSIHAQESKKVAEEKAKAVIAELKTMKLKKAATQVVHRRNVEQL